MNKFFILVLVIVAGVWGELDEQSENLKKWHMECFEETKVEPDLVLKLKSGHWRIENKAVKKWVLCILKKLNVMSNEGVLRMDVAMALVPSKDKAVVGDFIDECLPQTASAPYEIAWKFAKCYHLKAKLPENMKKKLHYISIF